VKGYRYGTFFLRIDHCSLFEKHFLASPFWREFGQNLGSWLLVSERWALASTSSCPALCLSRELDAVVVGASIGMAHVIYYPMKTFSSRGENPCYTHS
jgi:hypothetical protein